MTRPVVIGAGHNGLVAAFYLAKAGYRPIVLERREEVGGAAGTSEIHPGFHVPTLAHALGPIRPDVAADLGLVRRGVEVIAPAPRARRCSLTSPVRSPRPLTVPAPPSSGTC